MSTTPIFVDTEVLLASVDERDPARQARAREWLTFCWQTRSGRISSQVLNELYNQAIQRFSGPHVLQQVRAQVRRLRVWLPPHLDAYTVDGAWDLQDRYGLGYWDALIVSSAHQQGCRYLLTEALPHDQVLDAVRALPENYRNAVYLHYYEGYTAAEVGRMLGAPTNTVLSWLRRARAQLHTMLKEEIEDEVV
jgi:predicted nucleic acid-binding protein